MFAVVGTIPNADFPLVAGNVTLKKDKICIQENRCSVNRGTPALLAAAIKAGEVLGQPTPFSFLVGDIGLGKGSRRLYKHLCTHLPKTYFKSITFHYLMPDVDWHNKVLFAIKDMPQQPILIADAGFMYAAKMSGQAPEYDLFTPDIGELAFLADEEAPHPFYTRGFILHEENKVPDLIARAYKYENAAKYVIVKGKHDYVASRHGIQATINTHIEEAMEATGGTGDTLTGIISSLVGAGFEINEAAVIAAKTNRLAGHYTKPTPATQVIEIIYHIPKALEKVLHEGKEESLIETGWNGNVTSIRR